MKRNDADFDVQDEGTIALLHPLTAAAREFLEEYFPAGGDHTYFGNALVVEHRFVDELIKEMDGDGYTFK